MFAICALMATKSYAAVWENKNEWTPEWESKYQAWVAENWDTRIFSKEGFYKGLKVDCADTVYSMRYIFAADNALPFAIKDSTGGKKLISNDTTMFDNSPPEQRKRKFLVYLYDVVSTHTLARDSYPVAVNRQEITSGRLLLLDELNHHSYSVKLIRPSGMPHLIYSTRPAKTLILQKLIYPNNSYIFPKGLKPETNAGFRAFRKPEHLLLPVWEVPGYSLEQYNFKLSQWTDTLEKRLGSETATADETLNTYADSLCNESNIRRDAVNDGLAYLEKVGPRCLNAQEYDDYSTPSKDKRLEMDYLALLDLFKKTSTDPSVKAETYKKIQSIIEGGQENTFCELAISSKLKMTLHDFLTNIVSGRVSSNPHDSLLVRWGIEKGPGTLAKKCPTY